MGNGVLSINREEDMEHGIMRRGAGINEGNLTLI